MQELRNCEYCGKEFTVKYHCLAKKYCNMSCAISWRNKNVPFSEERKRHISESNLGKTTWNKGIPRTEEDKAKMRGPRPSILGDKNPNWGKGLKGKDNPAWCGGITNDFRHQDVNYKKFIENIRKRDGNKCVICGAVENGKKLATHHINYIKTDDYPENMVTLCHSCHSKTNYNREGWITYFKNKCLPSQ